MRIHFLLSLLLAIGMALPAQGGARDGFKIEVQLDNFKEDTLILASYYGKNNKIVDSAAINNKGKFVFKGDERLAGGVYLIIMPPKNTFFELVIDKEQDFSIRCDAAEPVKTMKVKGSEENRLFYEYIQFMADKRKEAERISKELESAKGEGQKSALEKRREKLDKEVTGYFGNIIKQYPSSINALIAKAAQPTRMPERLRGPGADQMQRYLYYKTHYFDNVDRGDDRLLRTNFLFDRVEYYMEKLTPQTPDSINASIDYVLEPMRKDGEMFRYYLVHLLNKYAQSKLVGMDAVYVHIVKNYYRKGLAPWTDEETFKKIDGNARDLEPILIGQIAPNIRMKKKDGSPLALHDIKSEYTLLYFWSSDCGHCKKASPHMKAFNEEYSGRGVTMYAVCTEVGNDVQKCWEAIDERGYDWLNLVDPYMQTRYKTRYNIKSTPQIFILDKNKKIIMKRIGAEQLDDVMDKIIEQDKKRQEERLGNG